MIRLFFVFVAAAGGAGGKVGTSTEPGLPWLTDSGDLILRKTGFCAWLRTEEPLCEENQPVLRPIRPYKGSCVRKIPESAEFGQIADRESVASVGRLQEKYS